MGIFDIFKKKEPVNLADTFPKPNAQRGKNKQEVINCITSGGGNCDNCAALNKCIRMKRKLRKIGVIK